MRLPAIQGSRDPSSISALLRFLQTKRLGSAKRLPFTRSADVGRQERRLHTILHSYTTKLILPYVDILSRLHALLPALQLPAEDSKHYLSACERRGSFLPGLMISWQYDPAP